MDHLVRAISDVCDASWEGQEAPRIASALRRFFAEKYDSNRMLEFLIYALPNVGDPSRLRRVKSKTYRGIISETKETRAGQ